MVFVSIQWYRQGSFDITLHTTGLMWCLSVFSGIGRAPLISPYTDRSDVVFVSIQWYRQVSFHLTLHTTGLMWCLSVFSGIGRAPLISPYTGQV